MKVSLVKEGQSQEVTVPVCSRCDSGWSYSSEEWVTSLGMLGALAGIVAAIVLAVRADVSGVRLVKGILLWGFLLAIVGGIAGAQVGKIVNRVASPKKRLRARACELPEIAPFIAEGYTLL